MMKASLKFREEHKPLVRAKIPLSILGFPFQSGIVAGESKELSLNLATFFESGPSIKVTYRPNDSFNPFSLIVKTGMGAFGSPVSSPLLMSAEFNLLSRGNPAFMLHFKPKFGDFSIKKSQSSSVLEKNGNLVGSFESSSDDCSIEIVDSPDLFPNGFSENKVTVLPQPAARAIVGALSGVEVSASTKLPVRSRAVMNFRWGLRVPAEIKSGRGVGFGDSLAGINFRKIPFLVMNKIGIEHVDGGDDSNLEAMTKTFSESKSGSIDMAEVCMKVKRQMETLQAENSLLKRAVEDLRHEIASGRLSLPASDFSSSRYRDNDRNAMKNSRLDRRGNEKKSTEADVSEELKKALKGTTAAGA